MKTNLIVFVATLALLLQSCGLADLRTATLKKEGITVENEQKGRALLDAAWRAQGLDKLDQFHTYEVVGVDHWKGLLGSMGKVWPVNKTPLRLRYAVGTFDGQVEVLEGKHKGFRAGLQSWRYYEQEAGEDIQFLEKQDERITFGLAAYQYFFELASRLRNAPVVTYLGEASFNGKAYEQVFVSWEKPEPHDEHDQYVLYIDPNTKLIEYTSYTLRENYLPGPKKIYGSIHFGGLKEVQGIKIPFQQSVFLNAPKEKERKYIHQFTISEFKFDSFDSSVLYPEPGIEPIGDQKLTVQN